MLDESLAGAYQSTGFSRKPVGVGGKAMQEYGLGSWTLPVVSVVSSIISLQLGSPEKLKARDHSRDHRLKSNFPSNVVNRPGSVGVRFAFVFIPQINGDHVDQEQDNHQDQDGG